MKKDRTTLKLIGLHIIALALAIPFINHKLMLPPEKLDGISIASMKVYIPVVDTTNTFHDDFDSSYVFNWDCKAYTFKYNHICKQ